MLIAIPLHSHLSVTLHPASLMIRKPLSISVYTMGQALSFAIGICLKTIWTTGRSIPITEHALRRQALGPPLRSARPSRSGGVFAPGLLPSATLFYRSLSLLDDHDRCVLIRLSSLSVFLLKCRSKALRHARPGMCSSENGNSPAGNREFYDRSTLRIPA